MIPRRDKRKSKRARCESVQRSVVVGGWGGHKRSVHVVYPVDSGCRAFRGAQLDGGRKASDKETCWRRLRWMDPLSGFLRTQDASELWFLIFSFINAGRFKKNKQTLRSICLLFCSSSLSQQCRSWFVSYPFFFWRQHNGIRGGSVSLHQCALM